MLFRNDQNELYPYYHHNHHHNIREFRTFKEVI